jgi:hypothetical protein
MNESQPQSEYQEVLSVVTIISLVVGVATYWLATSKVPIVSPVLFWITAQVYAHVPFVHNIPSKEAPYLVCAVTVALIFFCLSLPFTPKIASLLSNAGVANMERQVNRLEKARAKIKQKNRDTETFIVE